VGTCLMAPPGSNRLDSIVNNELHFVPTEPAMASLSSILRAESSLCTPCQHPSRKDPPCIGRLARYRRLVETTANQIEGDPAIFNMGDLEQNLPDLVKNDPRLKLKFMRRMENLRQKFLAEQPQPMYVPDVVEIQDGVNKAFAEHSARKEQPLKGFFESMAVVTGHRDCKKQNLVVGTDKVRAMLEVFPGEDYDAPNTAFMIPRAQDVSMPMKFLNSNPTTTNPGAGAQKV